MEEGQKELVPAKGTTMERKVFEEEEGDIRKEVTDPYAECMEEDEEPGSTMRLSSAEKTSEAHLRILILTLTLAPTFTLTPTRTITRTITITITRIRLLEEHMAALTDASLHKRTEPYMEPYTDLVEPIPSLHEQLGHLHASWDGLNPVLNKAQFESNSESATSAVAEDAYTGPYVPAPPTMFDKSCMTSMEPATLDRQDHS